jgi:hypothetical protein
MNRATPKMQAFAERLIAAEAMGSNETVANVLPAFGGVVGKLRQPLASLTGEAGFRSLLSRALALARDDVRWLRAVHVKADGSLECPDLAQLGKAEIARGEAALVAQLLALLVTFIGEPLTLRLVENVWPEALRDNLVSSKEKNEKTE